MKSLKIWVRLAVGGAGALVYGAARADDLTHPLKVTRAEAAGPIFNGPRVEHDNRASRWIPPALFGLCEVLVAVTPLAAADIHALPDGKAEFASHCASCHGAGLTGGEHGPALVGNSFRASWGGQPARSLYSRIISTMPQSDPGSLTPPQALSITMYLFATNHISLSDKVISMPNDLNGLTIPGPAP